MSAVAWHYEEIDYRDHVQVCEACGFVAQSEDEQDAHEQVAHHTCPGCGETFSADHHPSGDSEPTVVGSQTFCHPDCLHNHLWDAGFTIVAGQPMTTTECLRRSRLQVVAA